MVLKEDEYVVTAWAEVCSGPSLFNAPVWVLVGIEGTNDYRLECLQPEEQSQTMKILHSISSTCHEQMRKEVERICIQEDK